jgi:hypothetical protein
MPIDPPADPLALYSVATLDAACPSLVDLAVPAKQYLIRSALAGIHAYLGWAGTSLAAERSVEQVDGYGHHTVLVSRGPIRTVHGVWLDVDRRLSASPVGESTAADLLVDPTDYRVNQAKWGLLRVGTGGSTNDLRWTGGTSTYATYARHGATGRLGTVNRPVWPTGVGVLWVDHTHGFGCGELPWAITAAVGELASYAFKVAGAGGLMTTSRSYQDVSESQQLVTAGLAASGSLLNTRNLLAKAGLHRPTVLMSPY